MRELFVPIVSDLQPMFHFVVYVRRRLEWDAMRDAVLLREAAGVDQPVRWFQVSEGESYVNAFGCGGFNLREDVVAIKRNYCLARTRLNVLADLQTSLKQLIIDWPESRLRA